MPAELQDWHNIEIKDFRRPWEHFTPFLASHGYSLFGTWAYDEAHLQPMKPARDPFHPTDEEAYVYTARSVPYKLPYFFQAVSVSHPRSTHVDFCGQLPIGYFALDRQSRYVYIKAVPLESSEWQIIQALSTDPLRADVRNHTIPNVRIIPAGEWVFIVQAFWYSHWNLPPFDTVKSRLEMARQVLEVSCTTLYPASALKIFHRVLFSCMNMV